tara:strand:- start:235 stop:360 length:126 start_codon:yes stop_codon:yes gene_type:complete
MNAALFDLLYILTNITQIIFQVGVLILGYKLLNIINREMSK